MTVIYRKEGLKINNKQFQTTTYLKQISMQNFLEVTAINNRADKNGRPYQQVTFSQVNYFGERKIKTGNVRTRNLWSTTPGVKGDNLYGQLVVGDLVAGSIQSFNTTTFVVNEREVNKTTLVVFDFEDGVKYANSQLKQNGACVVDEHGQPTATFSLPQVVPVGVDDLQPF